MGHPQGLLTERGYRELQDALEWGAGVEVSPHCDSKHKLGSHLFYFNDSSEWDPSWGGETLILEDLVLQER